MQTNTDGYAILKTIHRLKDLVFDEIKCHYKELNLTGPQGMMIHLISKHGKQKISFFADKMSLSNSTVTGIVDRLEKRGFVNRMRDENDRRAIFIDLSDALKERFDGEKNMAIGALDKVLKHADASEADAIFRGFDALEQLLERIEHAED